VDEQEWRAQNAARVRVALQRPEVRVEVLTLLGLDDARRRARRLEAARRELASIELRWKLAEDEVWEP
jgi:hypothetical protein